MKLNRCPRLVLPLCLLALVVLAAAGCGESDAVVKDKKQLYLNWEADSDYLKILEKRASDPAQPPTAKEKEEIESTRALVRIFEQTCQKKYGVHPSKLVKYSLPPR